MLCPACRNKMTTLNIDDLSVDVCDDGCGGLWFDAYELKKVDGKDESAGKQLLDIEKNSDVRVDHNEKRSCPRCKGQVMIKHFMSVKNKVEVDECPACGGLWLDHGELGMIRDMFPSEEARHKAAHEYFDNIFGSELKKMGEKNKEQLEKARKIAKTFRYICPSNYIKGDQDWGAF